MKPDDLKTTAGYEPIKAKALHLPLDIIDVKSNFRSNITPDAFETSTPSVYALRFFASTAASEAVRSRLSKSRISQPNPDSPKDKNDIHLSPVELTINKKIKYPHEKKKQFGREKPQPVDLTPSDREIIEELRDHLRTQPRNGTTSVLEAIGDQEIREQRFYYEPMRTFMRGEDPDIKHFSDSGLRVVNIMIPSLDKGIHPESDIVLPLTLSRHKAAVSRNANRLRGAGTVTFLPKVEGNSMMGQQQSFLRFHHPEMPSQSREPHNFTKRKTQFNLPRIGLKRDEEFDIEEADLYKRRRGVATMSENRAKATTVQLPTSTDDDSSRNFSGFPRRATTTATGKAHLIGPMNKMDMIAEYSKALQNGLISYNEYMKKLSVLSLHKVPLGKSVQRHFHLVRDGSNNMKPKLTHVDVSSKSGTQISSESSEHSEGNKLQRSPVSRKKAKTSQGVHFGPGKAKVVSESSDLPSPSKQFQSQLHRVEIGEGLSFEKPKPDPDVTDGLIVTDLARYTHVHHPRQGKVTQYHWNHESAFGSGSDTWSNKHWPSSVTAKVPNKINPSLKSLEASKDGTQSSAKVLLSMEEYLKMNSPHDPSDLTKSRQKNDILGSARFEDLSYKQPPFDGVNLAEENFDYIGKIPEPVSGSEPMGLGTREILRSVDFKLPSNATPREDLDTAEDPSDIDSVFQGHLDNMLKTIKRAKATNKRKVPELRGLMPKVIPQVLVESTNQEESLTVLENNQTQESTSDLHPEFLNVRRNVPKNSPPPTARKSPPEDESNRQATTGDGNTMDESLSASVITVEAPSNVKIITERLDSQPFKGKIHPQPKTPHSVQSNRSVKLVVPNADEGPNPFVNNSEVRIMTASVDLIVPLIDDDERDGATTDRSRLEVTITSMPVAPPASLATSADGSMEDNDED